MVKMNQLSGGKLALYDPDDPHKKVLIYTPPRDKSKRYYNSQ